MQQGLNVFLCCKTDDIILQAKREGTFRALDKDGGRLITTTCLFGEGIGSFAVAALALEDTLLDLRGLQEELVKSFHFYLFGLKTGVIPDE